MLTLTIQKRAKTEKNEALRAAGKIPAVYYGHKEAATSISLSQAEFAKVWKQAGESSVVSLKDGAHEMEALIKEVDMDPITSALRHADFYVIEKGKKLEIATPLVFVGTSAAVKELGGILVKVLHTLKIKALPKDLPQHIEIDISALVDFDSQILAKNIKLPAGVELDLGADEVVASVAKPVEEKEEPVAAPDLAAIEVEKKGKKDEEGAEGAADAGAAGKDAKAGKDDKKADTKK